MDGSEQPNVDSQIIVNLLEQSSAAGFSFEQAKEKLISQGYTETAITLATDNYDYGSKQVSDISTKARDYFQAHPDQASEDGNNLLVAQHKEDITNERNKAALDVVAGSAAGELGVGNTDAEVEYDSNFASDVGIPLWLFFVLGIAVNGVAYLLVRLLHINDWYYLINGALFLAMITFLIKRMK